MPIYAFSLVVVHVALYGYQNVFPLDLEAHEHKLVRIQAGVQLGQAPWLAPDPTKKNPRNLQSSWNACVVSPLLRSFTVLLLSRQTRNNASR